MVKIGFVKIIEGKKAEVEKRSGGVFIGTMETMLLIDGGDSKEFRANIVTFHPGTRNKFHIHDHEQILFVTHGKGIVATEKEERTVTVGDIILIPAGENHWHGTAKDSAFSHLYVYSAETKTSF